MKTGSIELTVEQQAKISSFARGIRVDRLAEEQLTQGGRIPLSLHEYATTGGVTFELSGGVFVNAPFDEWWCDEPEATLTYDPVEESFVVRFRGEDLPARTIPLPGYLDVVDSQGIPVTNVAMSHCDRVRVSPIVGCAFDCKFCDLAGLRYVRRPAEQLVEALQVAAGDDVLPVRHVLVSGGTPGPRDYGYYDEVCEAVVDATPMLVDVMMVPRPDPGWIDRVVARGVHGFAINVEVFGDAYAREIIRLKHRLGLPVFAKNLERAVELTGGAGRVRSLILPGIEPLDATLDGVEFIARLGADPVLSPFRPAAGTKLAASRPPTVEELERVYLESLQIAARHGVKLGPRCIPCQHNTLSFQDGSEDYYFTS